MTSVQNTCSMLTHHLLYTSDAVWTGLQSQLCSNRLWTVSYYPSSQRQISCTEQCTVQSSALHRCFRTVVLVAEGFPVELMLLLLLTQHFQHLNPAIQLVQVMCNYSAFMFYVLYFVGCVLVTVSHLSLFLPRCMECRRGLAMRILSVCLSVCHTREL